MAQKLILQVKDLQTLPTAIKEVEAVIETVEPGVTISEKQKKAKGAYHAHVHDEHCGCGHDHEHDHNHGQHCDCGHHHEQEYQTKQLSEPAAMAQPVAVKP